MDEILKSFLAGVGGAGVVILGLSAWVGKVLASKISEADKSRHARDLELYRAVIQQNNNQRQRISNVRGRLSAATLTAPLSPKIKMAPVQRAI